MRPSLEVSHFIDVPTQQQINWEGAPFLLIRQSIPTNAEERAFLETERLSGAAKKPLFEQ
jgi:hypothetical protein